MNRFKIKNVRCFAEPDSIEIRPLTLLIGENSTGKTTTLACFHTILSFLTGEGLRFIQNPFHMGTFREIARNQIRNGGQADSFLLEISDAEKSFTWGFEFVQKAKGFEPNSSAIYYQTPDFKIMLEESTITFLAASLNRSASVNFGESVGNFLGLHHGKQSARVSPEGLGLGVFNLGLSLSILLDIACRENQDIKKLANKVFGDSNQFIQNVRYPFSLDLEEKEMPFIPMQSHRIHSFAPIRSQPQRTYDPVTEAETPEGEHVPMYLASLYRGEKEKWSDFKKGLERFGRDTGLFQNISIRSHGRSMSDSFQIELKVAPGSANNLIDVGYGVSQALPIFVDILRANQKELFLIQQPEVHLHPRGQAELGSFFGRMAKERNHTFLVETHSDYLLDRVRMDVRDKEHPPTAEDVSIIYFERARKGSEVKIHNIALDKQGNFRNAPDSYRDFFIKEHQRFLGID